MIRRVVIGAVVVAVILVATMVFYRWPRKHDHMVSSHHWARHRETEFRHKEKFTLDLSVVADYAKWRRSIDEALANNTSVLDVLDKKIIETGFWAT
ncbi:MAG: hypothetical protein AAF517_24245 [Planctomycetota bacterium]